MPESMTCPFIKLRFNKGEEGSSISRRRRIQRGNFYKVSCSNSLSLKINVSTNLQGILASHLSSVPALKDADTRTVKLGFD